MMRPVGLGLETHWQSSEHSLSCFLRPQVKVNLKLGNLTSVVEVCCMNTRNTLEVVLTPKLQWKKAASSASWLPTLKWCQLTSGATWKLSTLLSSFFRSHLHERVGWFHFIALQNLWAPCNPFKITGGLHLWCIPVVEVYISQRFQRLHYSQVWCESWVTALADGSHGYGSSARGWCLLQDEWGGRHSQGT